MKTILKKGNIDVIELEISPFLSHPFIHNYKILDEKNIPFYDTYIKYKDQIDPNEIDFLHWLITDWFQKRSIPNSRVNLDYFIMNLFGYEYHECGRMYGFQNFAAMLAYYISAEDDYFLTPIQDELVTLMNVWPHDRNIFFWYPADFEKIKEIKANPDPNLRKYLTTPAFHLERLEGYKFPGCYPTMDFTIRTEEPAYYEIIDGKPVLRKVEVYP